MVGTINATLWVYAVLAAPELDCLLAINHCPVQVVISTGDDNACTNAASAEAVAYVTTVQEGGRVEHQQLTLATEAGYVLGDYYSLDYSVASGLENTGCLEWGATAADMSAVLSALPSVGDISLPTLTFKTTGMDITPSATVPLTDSPQLYVDGLLKRGDVIRVAGSSDDAESEFTVKSISADGTKVTLETTFRAATGGGQPDAAVTRVVPDAVTVSRSGTGKSVTEVQRLVVTATSEVVPLTGQGFFRLRWAHDGVTAETVCLAFGAEAATVQAALEALPFDFDGSAPTQGGHVLVTREGDASAASGFGYEYTFVFKGVAGVSTVVGNVEQLEVILDSGALEGIGICAPNFIARCWVSDHRRLIVGCLWCCLHIVYSSVDAGQDAIAPSLTLAGVGAAVANTLAYVPLYIDLGCANSTGLVHLTIFRWSALER